MENEDYGQDSRRLVDLADVSIDPTLPVAARIDSVKDQMAGNPYEFSAHGTVVRISFNGDISLDEAVARFLGLEGVAAH